MKNTNLLVENTLPNANETKMLEKKDRVIEILVGKPNQEYVSVVGETPRIQLNGKFAKVDEVGPFVLSELAKMPENVRKVAMVSLKVDKSVKMGIVTDIKQELRKVKLFKINYTTVDGDTFMNL